MRKFESTMIEYLGGKKNLGASAGESPMNLHDRVFTGLPAQCVTSFKLHSGLTNVQVSALLGVSEKTFIRWQANPKKPIDAVSSDRLYRTARIMALAEDILEDAEAARQWIGEPQIGLDKRVPRDLLTTDIGACHVEELLLRMEHGYLA